MSLTPILPPPPTGEPAGSLAWEQWYIIFKQIYGTGGLIPWSIINFAGSLITDIQGGVLAVVRGGTGVQTSTGTVNTVLSNYPTFNATTSLADMGFVGVSDDPTVATEGDLYYNTLLHAFIYFNGINWVAMGSGSGVQKAIPVLTLNSIVPAESLITVLGAINIYTSTTSLSLDSEIPGISVIATSP